MQHNARIYNCLFYAKNHSALITASSLIDNTVIIQYPYFLLIGAGLCTYHTIQKHAGYSYNMRH